MECFLAKKPRLASGEMHCVKTWRACGDPSGKWHGFLRTGRLAYRPAMSEPPVNPHRSEWLLRARHVSRQVNFGWWLEFLAAPLLIAAIIGAVVLIVLRQQLPELSGWALGGATAGGLALLALISWLRASRRFESPEQSLVRLEATMRLRNRLSAAMAGVAPWPAPGSRTEAGLRWHWPRLLVPPLGALALLAAGLLIPVSAKSAAANTAPDEPQAWKQLETQLDHLTREQVANEEYLEEMRKKLDDLRTQKEEQWFSHSSLEASDSLRKSHRSEIDRMERELDRADKALEKLDKNGAAMGQQERDGLLNEFDQALQGLQNGAMKPNPELLEQMKQFDPQNLGQLNQEQLQQLRENLKKHGEAMQQCQGGEGGEGDWNDELLAGDGEGEGEGDEPGDGPGKGGINRGPGHAPGVLGAGREALDTGELTGVEAKDLSRSLPGDLLQLQDGDHDVDLSASATSRGGELQSTGTGGERVWRESLDPDEQKTLKRFFE